MDELVEYRLSTLLNEVLGPGTVKNHESIHFCPFCTHHKPKLQVSLTTHAFHCWVCDAKGRSIISLFRRAKVSQNQIDQLTKLIPNGEPKIDVGRTIDNLFAVVAPPKSYLALPKEFHSLWNGEKLSGTGRYAAAYLKRRGVTQTDLVKHNIGYCEEGDYRDRVIIPSYDERGMLNFFTGRDIYGTSFVPYKNPPVSKNIIGFESFVNWSEPLVICEGPMDALAVKRNAIPLFGKTISPALELKIINKRISKVYLALDKDAVKQSMRIAKKLISYGVKIFIPQFDEKDPSKLGFAKVEEILNSTDELDFSNFINLKMSFTK
jgi:DNA primase